MTPTAPPATAETTRPAALDRYNILDTPAEAGFDDIVNLAAEICATPVALIGFVAGDRQWFKARVGFDPCQMPLSHSVCAHALRQPGLLVIPDLREDPRTRENPLVTGEPHIRFYAGARLEAADGHVLGTLCVIDGKPRPGGLTPAQATSLERLARQVVMQLEMRRAVMERDAIAGRPPRFAGAARDIAEQREAQEALRRSEGRYRTLFEALDAGFAIIEMRYEGERPVDYRFVEVNPAFERQTGLAGAAGRWARDLVPDLEPHWFETYGRVIATGESLRFENGSAALGRWFDVHAFRIGDPGERQVALLFYDISERKRAEDALQALNTTLERQVEERTRERNRLWQTTSDLMGTAGLDGYLKAVNPAWERMLGWTEEELLSRPFFDFVDPADHAETRDVVGRLARGEPVGDFVDRVRDWNGGFRTIMWTAVPEPAGEVFYIVGRDLTEQLRVEEQLRQSQKMEAVGQLTGGIAHDFNNLLTGISGSLELLQARIGQGRFTEIDRYVNAAQGASKRAAALTHRLLAFSRRQTLDPKPTDPNRMVIGMEELIRRTIGPEITLEVVAAIGLWPTMVDPSQLENALLNLCINARDAMPTGGRITIETGNKWLDDRAAKERDLPPGQYLSLCVTDTGTGMAPDVVARAFEPFFTTKPIGQGTGLGLSMIYGFARQSGGQVRIYSEVGDGTTVCIYLPRHYGAADEMGPVPDLSKAPRAEQDQTVLIVDDEPTVRMLVTEVLEDLGYTAIEAADGAAGLKVLRSDVRIDLLVTDVGLPGGLNGRQMADAARVDRPGLKVLFITGYAENAVVGNGHLAPGMQVLTKPFVMEALASRIKELIAKD